jgi:DNA-binding CsgD family transcriptional regulator
VGVRIQPGSESPSWPESGRCAVSSPSAPYAVCVRFTWPLTGRSEEMRTIEAAVSASDRSGIVVCGPAGVGKSRIAREALTAAASKGCEVRWAIGTSSARALPLGAFAAWAASGGTDRLQLVRSVIESLTAAAPGVRVVVGVDDVHLLDDLSMYVLHQIVQRGAAKLVLTVRAGEQIPAGVQELWRAGDFDRLDLQPLARDETTMLVSATLGGSLDPQSAQRLWELTRGNVLYLRNLVEHELEASRLAQLHGFWRWTPRLPSADVRGHGFAAHNIVEPVLPPGLVELIESRIGALPTSVWDVIDALAVGEPIELGSLRRITDAAAVEEADTRGLIALEPVAGGVEVRVAHPLYGEVRRRRAAPTRLRRLRGLVAAELAAADHGTDMRVAVRRATLSLDSDLEPDPDLLVRAAQAALGLWDPLADRLTDAAIRAGGGAQAHFVRAQVLTVLARGQEAEEILAGMPTGELTDADYGMLVFLRATNMLITLADPAGAKKFVDAVSRTTPPGARSCIDAFLTHYWAAMGKPDAALRSSQHLDWDQLPDYVGASAALAIAVASGLAGRITDAIAAAHTGYDRASRAFNAAVMRFLIADAHVHALVLSGRVEEAWAAAERLRQQTADLPPGGAGAKMLSAATAGHAALAAGRLHTACSLLEPVVTLLSAARELLPEIGESTFLEYRYRLPHSVALAARGLTDEAAAALAALERARHRGYGGLDYYLAIARAWVAACQGAVSEAIKTVVSAAERAGANGQFAAEVMCWQTATQFGDSSGAPRLRELEAIVEGPRVGLAARFAAALRDNDGAELATVSEDFERMGDLVAAVDAAAHAALAYRRQGLRGSALGCSTRADALGGQCEGASTPAHRQATERLPLTDREREIAMLIGEGLSNRQVAARLTLSVRTVEGHIYKAMVKTGTNSRDDLAALLPRRRTRSRG